MIPQVEGEIASVVSYLILRQQENPLNHIKQDNNILSY